MVKPHLAGIAHVRFRVYISSIHTNMYRYTIAERGFNQERTKCSDTVHSSFSYWQCGWSLPQLVIKLKVMIPM